MTDKYLPFEQDGVSYNLYDMPKGFVIKGSLDLHGQGLTELPDLSEVVVEGDFKCSYNYLKTLKGAPKEVGGCFICLENHLNTLEYAPQKIGRGFLCNNNHLTSLEGAPSEINGSFTCTWNKLTTLEGGPQKVHGGFYCGNNKLQNLKGAPEVVDGDFDCRESKLTSLEGTPKEVGGNYYCARNSLNSLFGISALEKCKGIYCDDALGVKYGFYDSERRCFRINELHESTLYKSELAAENVRCKLKQEQMEKREKATEKTKVAFDAWLKKKGMEPPKR